MPGMLQGATKKQRKIQLSPIRPARGYASLSQGGAFKSLDLVTFDPPTGKPEKYVSKEVEWTDS